MGAPTKTSLAARFLRAMVTMQGEALWASVAQLQDDTDGDDIDFVPYTRDGVKGWTCVVVRSPERVAADQAKLDKAMGPPASAVSATLKARLAALAYAGPPVEEGPVRELQTLLGTVKELAAMVCPRGALTPEEMDANQKQIDQAVADINRCANATKFSNGKVKAAVGLPYLGGHGNAKVGPDGKIHFCSGYKPATGAGSLDVHRALPSIAIVKGGA